MIEMRQDPTTRTWILVGRSGGDPGRKESPDGCPFCPGREAETSQEIETPFDRILPFWVRPEAFEVSLERLHILARSNVPELHGAVSAAAGDVLAVF